MMSYAEFLKIKEKQKAFGMNNGLRVHEVFYPIFILNLEFQQCFCSNLDRFLISARFLRQGCDGFHPGYVGKLLPLAFEVI